MNCAIRFGLLISLFFYGCGHLDGLPFSKEEICIFYNKQPISLNMSLTNFQEVKGLDWRSSEDFTDSTTNRFGTNFKNINVLFSNDVILEIRVTKTGIITKRGISIGNTLSEVIEKYGRPNESNTQAVGQKIAYKIDTDRVNIDYYQLYFIINDKSKKVSMMGLTSIPSTKWLSMKDFQINVEGNILSLEDNKESIKILGKMKYFYEENDWGGEAGFDNHLYSNENIDLFFTNWGGNLTKIVFRSSKIVTSRGVKIGDSIDEVIRKYGFYGDKKEEQIYQDAKERLFIYRFLDFNQKEYENPYYFLNEYQLVFELKGNMISGIFLELRHYSD